jgi:dTDP-glucose 4,6-dehydratase
MSDTVAVIGSNSFSGADFIDLVLQETDSHVVGLSRSPEKRPLFLRYRGRSDLSRFRFAQMDLNRDMGALQDLLAAVRPAYVVNFAAQSEVAPSWDHPEQWFQTNAVSTAALANFLKNRDWLRRYVHISTPEIYGSCHGLVREDAPFNPSTPYAASRAAAELMLRTLIQQSAFPAVVVRSANVYGAGQQLHKIIPRALIHLKLGRTIDLHGGGTARRSFIHVRDVSRGELAIMQRGHAGGAYHLATETTIRICDLVRRLCARVGADFDRCTRSVDDRPGQDGAYQLDCSAARSAFGWHAQIPLEAGLAEVTDWIDREWDLIRRESLTYTHRP